MQGSPVQFEFEEVSPVEKRLKVEIAKEQVNAKLEAGFRTLNHQVNLKGFRKGHAPRSMLEKMFGKKVGADAAKELAQAAKELRQMAKDAQEMQMLADSLEALQEAQLAIASGRAWQPGGT